MVYSHQVRKRMSKVDGNRWKCVEAVLKERGPLVWGEALQAFAKHYKQEFRPGSIGVDKIQADFALHCRQKVSSGLLKRENNVLFLVES